MATYDVGILTASDFILKNFKFPERREGETDLRNSTKKEIHISF